MKALFLIVLLISLLSLVKADLGIDISAAGSSDFFSCAQGSGVTWTAIRAWRSTCETDPNAPASISNALALGLSTDVYFFPAASCSMTASDQVKNMLQSISGLAYSRVWFDIESGGGWSDPDYNSAWLQEAVDYAVSSIGQSAVGIYSNENSWTSIMGNNSNFSSFQLWYPHYDNDPSFSDFVPFAGWTSPTIKQYVGDSTMCNVGVDLNYFES
jgi:hypothetical protein